MLAPGCTGSKMMALVAAGVDVVCISNESNETNVIFTIVMFYCQNSRALVFMKPVVPI